MGSAAFQVNKSTLSSKPRSMQAYSPFNGKKFETLSYLPQLNNDDIRKQIDYMTRNNWTPCLEFSEDADVYLNTRMGPGYYDNRYWSCTSCPCSDAQILARSSVKSTT